ncbi:hypothetical protein BJV82DRAFT_676448 [Fennellomyces sp. T-0311]|nr:hypothetical protein BJV82DRAFT_676448 [Fennellomyces sp. T-0311]
MDDSAFLTSIQTTVNEIKENQSEIIRRLECNQLSSSSTVNSSSTSPMATGTVIRRPELIEVNGVKTYKIRESDIVALINPDNTKPKHQVQGALRSIRKCRQRSVDTLRHILQNTEYATASWTNIPWKEYREPEVNAFESIVLAQTGVDMKACEGNWAADHLLSMTWNNSAGYWRQVSARSDQGSNGSRGRRRRGLRSSRVHDGNDCEPIHDLDGGLGVNPDGTDANANRGGTQAQSSQGRVNAVTAQDNRNATAVGYAEASTYSVHHHDPHSSSSTGVHDVPAVLRSRYYYSVFLFSNGYYIIFFSGVSICSTWKKRKQKQVSAYARYGAASSLH